MSLMFPIQTYYLAILIYGIAFIFNLAKKERLSIFFLGVAFVINLVSEISGRYLIWPYCNMFAEPFFMPLCLAGISFILIIFKQDKQGLSIVPVIVLFSCPAIFFSEGYYPPFTLMSKSMYAHLFHLFVFISHGLLISGAYLAIRSVFVKERYDISYRVVIWGFSFLCLAGLFGMVWSYLGRSDVISWNHYYFHSIAIWFYYVGFLHLHLTRGWDQKRKAWILLGGVSLIFWFDYLPQTGGLHIPGVLDARLYKLF